MKKFSFLLLLILGLSSISFTTSKTTDDLNENELELLLEIDFCDVILDDQGWSSWYTTDCLRGLDFKLKNGGYNKYADKYRWSITFRNRYKEKIHFTYKAVAPHLKNEIRKSGKTTDRLHVDGNNGERGSYYLVPSQNSIYVYVNKVRIGEKDWGSDYIQCDK